jgi:protease-4
MKLFGVACRRSAAVVVAVAGVAVATGPAMGGDGADKPKVGMLVLEGSPKEKPGALAWLLGEDHPTLRTLVSDIDDAAEREDLQGVVIRLKDAELKTSQIEELGAAMQRLREAGKKVHVFAEGYSTPELLLGSYADEIIVQRGGEVSLPGVYMEEMYFADTLAWVGVKADMVQVGAYKGASEPMARSGPSPEWDQNINQLLDSLYGDVRGILKRGRHLSDEQLDKAMEKAWLATAAEAKSAGLVDAEVDLASLSEHLAKAYGQEIAWDKEMGEEKSKGLDLSSPFALLAKLSEKPPREATGPSIALVHIDGPIIDGDSGEGGLLSEGGVGSRTIRNALEDIRKQDLIKGVVVRIDSPGGSAVASEIIWQGLRRVAEKKPVWVSVGSMAASGGYYIAVGGDRIYVDPSSIVGSIGVVGGKLALSGLYEKLKLHVVSRSRGPMAGMFKSPEPWTSEQIAMVRQKMTDTYELFTNRVEAGRKGIDLSKTAEGRLFTGDKAIAMKMADKVGGLDDAIVDMAEKLDLRDYDVMEFPAPKSIPEVLQDMLGGLAMGPGGGAGGDGAVARRGVVADELVLVLKEAVGPRAWPAVRDALGAYLQLRTNPVLLVMPRAIVVR